MTTADIIFSYRSPGRYAFSVLGGALEAVEDSHGVRLLAPRTFPDLCAAVQSSVGAGHPTLVCWSFYSPSMDGCAQELARLRARVPSGWTSLAGGVHVTGEPADALRAGFDRILVGEGEHALRDIAVRLSRGRSFDDVPGVGRLQDGRAVLNGRGAPVEELDAFPAMGLRHRLYGAIEITRGCIYACRFCQTPYAARARFRHRSAANAAHWAGAFSREGLRDIRFITPSALSYGAAGTEPDLDAVEDLLRRVREAVGRERRVFFGTFPSELRPEHVSARAVALIRTYADNDNVIVGGQSGSDAVLAATHRGHDAESIRRAVALCLEGGLRPNVDFILGLPGETPEDAARTLSLVEELGRRGARAHVHAFMPLPGTPLRDAPPGRVDAVLRERLASLEGTGAAYGQWRTQEGVADALHRRRNGA